MPAIITYLKNKANLQTTEVNNKTENRRGCQCEEQRCCKHNERNLLSYFQAGTIQRRTVVKENRMVCETA